MAGGASGWWQVMRVGGGMWCAWVIMRSAGGWWQVLLVRGDRWWPLEGNEPPAVLTCICEVVWCMRAALSAPLDHEHAPPQLAGISVLDLPQLISRRAALSPKVPGDADPLPAFCPPIILQAGAKHVYGIECSSIADQATKIVQANGYADKVDKRQANTHTHTL